MVYRCYNYSNVIVHHGIKGQKWGIRRTPEQLGHVVKSGAKRIKNAVTTVSEKRKAKKQAKAEAEEEATKKKQAEDLETRKNKILKSRSARQLYENADLFTTQELQSAYNRLVLEKNISQLTPQEKSAGQKAVDFYINNGEKVAKVIGTTNKVITNAKRFRDLVNGDSSSKKSSDNKNPTEKSDKKKKGGSTIAGEARKAAADAAKDFSKDFRDIGDFAKKAAESANSSSTKTPKENIVVLRPDDAIVRDLSKAGRNWLDDQERRRLPGGR